MVLRQQTTANLVIEAGHLDDDAVTRGTGTSTSRAVDRLARIDSLFVKNLVSKGFSSSQMNAFIAEHRWRVRDFVSLVNSTVPSQSAGTVIGDTIRVYAFRVRAGLFGSNAQPWDTLPDALKKSPYPLSWEDVPINMTSQWDPKPYDNGTAICLDSIYKAATPTFQTKDGVEVVSWVVLKSKNRTSAYSINQVSEESLADFMMSAKVSRLTLDVEPTHGPCPAGGDHDHTGSANYTLAMNDQTDSNRQNNWRWCKNCQGLSYAGNPSMGPCPAGGDHDHTDSANYTLAMNDPIFSAQTDRQNNWCWCKNCQGLSYAGNPSMGPCPAGGDHDHTDSANYTLAMNDPIFSGQNNWCWCKNCQGLSNVGNYLRGLSQFKLRKTTAFVQSEEWSLRTSQLCTSQTLTLMLVVAFLSTTL